MNFTTNTFILSVEFPVHGRNVGRHRGIILRDSKFEFWFVKVFRISHYNIKMSFQLKEVSRLWTPGQLVRREALRTKGSGSFKIQKSLAVRKVRSRSKRCIHIQLQVGGRSKQQQPRVLHFRELRGKFASIDLDLLG